MARRMISPGVLVAVALAAGGCGGEFPLYLDRDPAPAIQTDTTGYLMDRDEVGYTVEIPFTFRNTTGRTIYLVHCRPGAPAGQPSRIALAMELQRQDGGGWTPAWANVVPQCLSAPVVLSPDQVHADTLRVFAGFHGSNFHPQFIGREIPGTYRLRWGSWYYTWDDETYSWSHPVEREYTTSNRFHLGIR